MELHAGSRGDLMPDPELDAVCAIFYSVFNDVPPGQGKSSVTGVVAVENVHSDGGGGTSLNKSGVSSISGDCGIEGNKRAMSHGEKCHANVCGVMEGLEIDRVDSEIELLHRFVALVIR